MTGKMEVTYMPADKLMNESIKIKAYPPLYDGGSSITNHSIEIWNKTG
jgi:hypothetical protein